MGEGLSTSPKREARRKELWRNRYPLKARLNRSLPLLVFTAMNELASNLVLVSLMESANAVGRGASSVGVVLIIQCVAQLLLGPWAGGLADRMGTRRAAIAGTVVQALLTVGLLLFRPLAILYVLAFLLMLARLLIIPARLALVRRVSSRATLLGVNTGIGTLTGAGLLLGPSVGAVLVVITREPAMQPAVAAVVFLASTIPALLLGRTSPDPSGARVGRPRSLAIRIRGTWEFIKRRRLVRTLLVCRVHSTMLWAAVLPLLTPLSRKLGLGEEGTGVMVAALGFGSLVGPFLAPSLFKYMKLSSAMLVTGLVAPLSALVIGLAPDIPVTAAFILVSVVSLGCAGLKVTIDTAFQRLTPEPEQGSLFGTEQAVLGLGWIVALAAVALVMSPALPSPNLGTVFVGIGVGGLVIFTSCWFAARFELRHVPAPENSQG